MKTKRLNPSYNVALMASAGTGKTYNLALRVVVTLMMGSSAVWSDEFGDIVLGVASPDSFGRVLCLTFTRKATSEMEQRVHEYLTKLANGQFDEKSSEYLAVSNALGVTSLLEIQSIAQRARERIYTDSSVLQIKTIDSFTAHILRSFPFEASVNPDFTVISGYKERLLQKKALQETFKNLSDKNLYVDLFFKYIHWTGEQPFRFTERLNEQINFILERSISLRESLIRAATLTPQDLLLKMDNALAIDDDIRNKLRDMICYLSDRTKYIKSNLVEKLPIFTEIAHGGSIKDLISIFEVLNPFKVTKDRTKIVSNKYNDDFQSLFELISHHVSIFVNLDIDILLHIAGHVQIHIDSIKKKMNMLSYSDLSRSVFNLLHSEDAVDKDYFYFRLDGRMEHILIDEFQDTSAVQWSILEPLVSEAMSGFTQFDKVGSFFCVGDPKQTIYRFRGSNPNFFHDVVFELGDKINKDDLDVNYRSDINIVNFINNLFHDANLWIKDETASDENYFEYIEQNAKSSSEGYVSVRLVKGRKSSDRKKERQRMLKDAVLEITGKGWKTSDIAILVSKRSDGILAHNFLEEEGIQSHMGFSEFLVSRPAFKVVYALVNYIYTRDSFHFAEFVLNHPSLILWKKISSPNLLERLRSLLDGYLLRTEGKSIYERIMNIGTKFSLLRRFGTDRDFLSMLGIIVQNISTVTNPLYFAEKLYTLASITPVADSSAGGVKIMTVHGAKGLQFPAVILFDINDRFYLSSKVTYFISKGNRGNTTLRKRLNKEYISLAPEEYFLDDQIERLLDRFEKINKLYVAATRAENMLFVFAELESEKTLDGYILDHFPPGFEMGEIPIKKSIKEIANKSETEDGELFRKLCWETLGALDMKLGVDVDKIIAELESKLDKLGYHKIVQDRFVDYVKKALNPHEESYIVDLGEGFLSKQYGIFFHESIYSLNIGDDVMSVVQDVYKRFGGYLPIEAKLNVSKQLSKLVNNEIWQELYQGEVYKERKFFYKGRLLVIDMYSVRGDGIVLVDFKTCSPNNSRSIEYEDQVLLYKEALEEKYSMKVRSYLVYVYKDISVIEV